jgi:hypothetical protein
MMHALHQSWTCWSRYVSFLTVVEEGSLHRAAARLRISLPALSVRCRPRKRIRRTVGQLHDQFGFWQVPLPYRLWIWKKDREAAIQTLDLNT